MPRKPRLHLPGGLYHVILRGNDRQDIFFEDEDRLAFYRLLEEGVRRFGYRVHAFCLMGNHVHLALQMGSQPLSKGLQNLSLRYTRYINRRRERVGHLFQGRYQALLVDTDSYGLELVRYIHLNPVRARLVSDPADYAYSGHLAYLGMHALSFLTTDWVLSQFDERVGVARGRYARFVAAGMSEGHRREFHHGSYETRVIGDDRFVERALRASAEPVRVRRVDLDHIVAYVCKGSELTERETTRAGKNRVASQARALIGWLAATCGNETLSEVARRLKRDVSAISRAVTQLERIATEGGAKGKALRMHQIAISQT
jgi:REP element-mobilizing transposase RayT